MKAKLMTQLLTAVGALCLTAATAHAGNLGCTLAGQYDGKYEGNGDHGVVRVSVSADDGTLTGQAQSQVTGETFAIGGVVNTDGTMTTSGAVSSGAQFSGRFFPNKAGGMWNKVVSADGGQRLAGAWGVDKIAAAPGCQ